MPNFKKILARAGKGAVKAGLGIDIGGGKPIDIAALVKRLLEDDEIADGLAQIIAAGLLLAAQAEEDVAQ